MSQPPFRIGQQVGNVTILGTVKPQPLTWEYACTCNRVERCTDYTFRQLQEWYQPMACSVCRLKNVSSVKLPSTPANTPAPAEGSDSDWEDQ